ncbi:unnamed protein product [Phytophthora lilii]|uniref:Unnamed protein product n=1 Tax=Phytophthora lilii TaxID=2077276 RepID=A0A9W6TJK2_9STRA|nr:unnamed protein product [Phytophthora lilii]
MGGTKRKRRGARGMWSGRRRSAKTGRLCSAPDAEPPKLRLTGTLLLRKELLHDFVLYLDADGLVALCEAMAEVNSTSAVLQDVNRWQHVLQAHCHVDLAASNVYRSVTLDGSCDALVDYLSLRKQLECFSRCVHVVKGDLGTITTVGDQQVDCLVFPTSSSYRNPGRGVAGRVHERAGHDLDRAVTNLAMRNTAKAGSVLCTVGCSSGARLMVHCVGPVGGRADAARLLYKTYVNAPLAADSNDVKCAAVASISTGLLRFPVPQAADTALSVVRDLVRLRPHWSVNVAFVCIDDEVYANFQRARQETFQAFHMKELAYPGLVKKLAMAEPILNHGA